MIRAFYGGSLIEGNIVGLNKDEHHHVFHVLRARKNEPIELLDGYGKVAKGFVTKDEKVLIKQILIFPPSVVELCPALLKKKAMEFVIREATAVGVRVISPIRTEHCEYRNRDKAAGKIAHWQMAAKEACKQSGNPWLPIISEPQTLPQFFEKLSSTLQPPSQKVNVESTQSTSTCNNTNTTPKKAPNEGNLLLVAALQQDTQSIFTHAQAITESTNVSLFIGPEGDFSVNEYNYLREQGAYFTTLGKHVLRSETAALYLLSVVDHLRGTKHG